MGEAYSRDGDVLGRVEGATKAEVAGKLIREFPDAAELRIRSADAPDLTAANNAGVQGKRAAGDWPGATEARQAMDARNAGARGNEAQPIGMIPERLSLTNVDEAFRYLPWNAEQISAGDEVRAALANAARVILTRVAESPLRTRALNNLIDARMIANAAITFRGRF